jgi:hypothetical protein
LAHVQPCDVIVKEFVTGIEARSSAISDDALSGSKNSALAEERSIGL